jgi:hypothetical protein
MNVKAKQNLAAAMMAEAADIQLQKEMIAALRALESSGVLDLPRPILADKAVIAARAVLAKVEGK